MGIGGCHFTYTNAANQGVWLMPAHPGVNELNSLTEIIVTVMTLSWLSD